MTTLCDVLLHQVKNQEVTLVRLKEQLKEMEERLEERAAVRLLCFTLGIC